MPRPTDPPPEQRTLWESVDPPRQARARIRSAAKATYQALTTDEVSKLVHAILLDTATALLPIREALPDGEARELVDVRIRDAIEGRVDVSRAIGPEPFDRAAIKALRAAEVRAAARALERQAALSQKASGREWAKRLRIAHRDGYCVPAACTHCRRAK